MPGSLDVLVRFIGDSSSISKETAKVQGTGGKISSWAKGVGAAIGGAFAVAKVKDFIDTAANLQDQLSASQVLFENGAKSVETWSKTSAEAFGVSQVAALEAANKIGGFGKAAGLTGQDLAGFSTDIVGLAGDLASFKGTSVEQALQAVGSAFAGEAEPMRAYNVMLDEGTLKARAMAMGLVKATGDTMKIKQAQLTAGTALRSYNAAVEKHGKDSEEAKAAQAKLGLAIDKVGVATKGTVPDLTAQQKILATQGELFAQTSDAQGDFAKTSDSAANQQKVFAAQMENAGTAIGTALLPIVQKIMPYLQKMANWIKENSTVVMILAGAMIVLAAAVWLAANPVIAIGLAIAALVAGLIWAYQNVDWFRTAVDALAAAAVVAWNAIVVAFKWFWDMAKKVFGWLRSNWPLLLAVMTGPIGIAVALIVKHWDKVKAAAKVVVDFVKSIWNGLVGFFSGIVSRIAGYASSIGRAFGVIKDAATSVYNWVRDKIGAIAGLISGFVGAISGAAGRVADVIKSPINAVIRAWNSFRFPKVDIPKVEILGKTIGGGTFGGWGLGHVSPLAKGGIVRSPTLALIGERGPEAVIPLGHGAAGTTYNVTVNAPVGADPATIGRTVVDYIRAYERANGKHWRAS
jgi:hypothetical protein